MSTHPVADVLDALLAKAGTLDTASGVRSGIGALAGARIFDGPPLHDVEDPDVVALGLSIDEVAGSAGTSTPGWGRDHIESFDLAGMTEAWSGDVDMPTRRQRALALFEGVRSLLVADPQVSGTCMRAYLARWSYRPQQDAKGSMAVVTFAIRVDARRFEGE